MAKAQGNLGANRTDVFLTVDVLDPQPEGDKWIAKRAVHVGLRGHQNYPDCPLTLFPPGRDLGTDAETDQNGSYTDEVELSGPGSYLIGAAIRDTSIRAAERRKATVEKLSTKQPIILRVAPSGEFGKQQLLIALEAEDGSRVGNCSGKINIRGKWLPIKTGSDGTLVYKLNFSEDEFAVRIHFGIDPKLRWADTLLGPQP